MKTDDANLDYFLSTQDRLAVPNRVPSSTRVVPAAYPQGYGDLSFDPPLVDEAVEYEDIPKTGQIRVKQFFEWARARHRQLAPHSREDSRSTVRE